MEQLSWFQDAQIVQTALNPNQMLLTLALFLLAISLIANIYLIVNRKDVRSSEGFGHSYTMDSQPVLPLRMVEEMQFVDPRAFLKKCSRNKARKYRGEKFRVRSKKYVFPISIYDAVKIVRDRRAIPITQFVSVKYFFPVKGGFYMDYALPIEYAADHTSHNVETNSAVKINDAHRRLMRQKTLLAKNGSIGALGFKSIAANQPSEDTGEISSDSVIDYQRKLAKYED